MHYKPVHLLGQLYSGLVPRMLARPRVELFDVATPKKGVPIPLPVPGGGLIWTGAFSTSYNHTWFLRRPSFIGLVQVPDGKQFAPFLADYFVDAPPWPPPSGPVPKATATPTWPGGSNLQLVSRGPTPVPGALNSAPCNLFGPIGLILVRLF